MSNILAYNRNRIISDEEVFSGSYSGRFLPAPGLNGISVDASTFFLRTPYTSDFDLSSGDFSIEARFFAKSFANASDVLYSQILICKDTYGSNFDWCISIWNNTTIKLFTSLATQQLSVTVPTMNINQWYHVKFERVGGVNTIYLDGVAYGSNSISITNNSLSYITIGCGGWNNPYAHFDGFLDEVRVIKGGVDSLYLKFETLYPDANHFTDDTGKLLTILPEPVPNLITECVDVVRDGLLVYLDSMNIRSYDRLTTNWVNLANPGTSDATLYGGYTHSIDGGIQFDGTTGRAIYNMDFTQAFTVMTIAKSNAPLWDDAGVITSARYNNGFVLHPFASSTQYASTIFSSSMGASNDIFTPSNIENVALYGTSSNGSNLNYGYFNDELHVISAPTSRTNGTNGDVYIGGDSPSYDTRFGNVTIYAHLYYNRQLSHDEVKQNYKALRSHF